MTGEPLDGVYLGALDVPLLRCYHSPEIPFLQGSVLKERPLRSKRPLATFLSPSVTTPSRWAAH